MAFLTAPISEPGFTLKSLLSQFPHFSKLSLIKPTSLCQTPRYHSGQLFFLLSHPQSFWQCITLAVLQSTYVVQNAISSTPESQQKPPPLLVILLPNINHNVPFQWLLTAVEHRATKRPR